MLEMIQLRNPTGSEMGVGLHMNLPESNQTR